MGDPDTKWHYLHPLYPDCFHAEGKDPNSPWYDDPRRYLDPEDEYSDYRRASYELSNFEEE